MGGSSVEYTLSGQVKVLYEGTWSTICGAGWDDQDATVVCRQLGFQKGQAHSGALYGRSAGITAVRDVQCSGTETTFQDCHYRVWGQVNCSDNAAVECTCESYYNNQNKYPI